MLNGRKISRDVYSRAMSGVSVAKKNGGQTSAIFANDTRWRPNSQILHRGDRSNSRVTETARPSGALLIWLNVGSAIVTGYEWYSKQIAWFFRMDLLWIFAHHLRYNISFHISWTCLFCVLEIITMTKISRQSKLWLAIFVPNFPSRIASRISSQNCIAIRNQ